MTRRYDKITQLRYALKVIVPLLLATSLGGSNSTAQTNRMKIIQRLGIQMQQCGDEGLPAGGTKEKPGKVCRAFGGSGQAGAPRVARAVATRPWAASRAARAAGIGEPVSR